MTCFCPDLFQTPPQAFRSPASPPSCGPVDEASIRTLLQRPFHVSSWNFSTPHLPRPTVHLEVPDRLACRWRPFPHPSPLYAVGPAWRLHHPLPPGHLWLWQNLLCLHDARSRHIHFGHSNSPHGRTKPPTLYRCRYHLRPPKGRSWHHPRPVRKAPRSKHPGFHPHRLRPGRSGQPFPGWFSSPLCPHHSRWLVTPTLPLLLSSLHLYYKGSLGLQWWISTRREGRVHSDRCQLAL